MTAHNFLNSRRLSIAAFSFFFAYLLSFLFEGQVLYSLLDLHGTDAARYILDSMIAHFMGLITCGLFVRSRAAAKIMMLGSMGICLIITIPFFFAPSSLWLGGLIISGYLSGCSVAAWGFFLRAFTPKNERIKSCRCSDLFQSADDCSQCGCHESLTVYRLSLSSSLPLISIAFILMLPAGQEKDRTNHLKTRHMAA